MKETFYITTPIYYPNDEMHIGHSYCSVATDTMARYKRLRGYDVKFLTGMDEHGQKIEEAAAKLGIGCQKHVDRIAESTRKLWSILDVEYDYFQRTTNPDHEAAVKKIFKKLYDDGEIYKGKYEGLYCVPCETFFTPIQLKDGKCPDCGRDVKQVEEEAYFFRLSKYGVPLIQHINENPDFISPVSRKNEMLNNFLLPGLEDLCVTRSSFKWGVPVEFDPEHVMYVWVDALPNYITALGYLSDNDTDYQKYWPADVHVVGKEIVRFHTIIWPAILMALGEPLPKQIFGHGWLLVSGKKIGKSLGNAINPNFLVERYGSDAIRYFLMREVAFGQDGNFSNEALINRINADLANDLGNLLSRTVGMIEKYFGGNLPKAEPIENEYTRQLVNQAHETVNKAEGCYNNMHFDQALTEIWRLISRANKYIDETTPWILAKDENRKSELANVLFVLAETLRIVAVLISPVMPRTPAHIFEQLNFTTPDSQTWRSIDGLLDFDPHEIEIKKAPVIFPRIDLKKELQELGDL